MTELKFGKKELKQVVEEYYKKYEDFDGVFTSGCSLDWVGYGMAEYQDAVVSMKIRGKLNFSGMKLEMTREVKEEDLFNIFKTVLGDQGFTVSSVTMNKGTTDSCEGYGMGERTVQKPYFRGVIVGVKEKTLVK